jgi:hypothetical protein
MSDGDDAVAEELGVRQHVYGWSYVPIQAVAPVQAPEPPPAVPRSMLRGFLH